MPIILNLDEIESFVEDGYVYLECGFSNEVAAKCRENLWEYLERDGISRSDSTSWPPKHSIDKLFGEEDGGPWKEVFTKRIGDIVNDICGQGTWTNTVGMGWWMVTFPGHGSPPWDHDGKCHVDGHWFQHYAFSKEVGCTVVMFFSDVLPEGGGTAVAVGSHKCIARALVEAGTRGMRPSEVAFCVDSCLSSAQYPLVELTGKAGDVVVMHPFLIHARSKNLAPCGMEASVRFMCHPSIPLQSHMNFTKPRQEMTPLELSIFQACAPRTDRLLAVNDLQGKYGNIDGSPVDTQKSLSDSNLQLGNDGSLESEVPMAGNGIDSQCSCCFHVNGDNLQSLLAQITPDRCEELHNIKKKRRASESLLLAERGEDDRRQETCFEHDHHRSSVSGKEVDDGKSGSSDANEYQRRRAEGSCGFVEDLNGQEQSSILVADVMGFNGFGSSRRSVY